MMRALLAALLMFALLPAQAHKPSDSYLTLNVEGRQRRPASGTSRCATSTSPSAWTPTATAQSPGASCARSHADIAAYALARLALSRRPGARARCALGEQLVDDHTDGAYAVLRFTAPARARRRALTRRLPPVRRHRPAAPRTAQARARAADARPPSSARTGARQTLRWRAPSRWRQFVDYVARRRLAHLDRLRPHPVPALAAAAGGAGLRRARRWQAADASAPRSSTCSRSSPRSRWRTRSR